MNSIKISLALAIALTGVVAGAEETKVVRLDSGFVTGVQKIELLSPQGLEGLIKANRRPILRSRVTTEVSMVRDSQGQWVAQCKVKHRTGELLDGRHGNGEVH